MRNRMYTGAFRSGKGSGSIGAPNIDYDNMGTQKFCTRHRANNISFVIGGIDEN